MSFELLEKHKPENWLVSKRYEFLFVAILLNILVPGLFPSALRDAFVSPLMNVVLVIACLLIVQKMKRMAIYVGVIGMLGVTFNWFTGYAGLIGLVIFSFYLGIIAIELFSDLVTKKSIGLSEIIGALDGYMIVGYIGALLFLAIHLVEPSAFSNVPEGRAGAFDLLYFGYITMLTIGYGEIVPQIEASRGLTIIIGLAGQFYLVVVIATFVGKFLMDSKPKN